MIESITIVDTTPFIGAQPTLLARTLNYVFGANGVGKTTISRFIASPDKYPCCALVWRDGRPLRTAVLNRDFVDDNFGQLKGIFTLGEKQKDAQQQIEAARGFIQTEQNQSEALRRTLEGEHGDAGKKADLAQLENEFKEKCWAQKVKHDDTFKDAFVPARNHMNKFKAKVLSERESNAAESRPCAELVERAETVFGERPTKQDPVVAISASALLAHEAAPILKKPVIGKSDIDIAAIAVCTTSRATL